MIKIVLIFLAGIDCKHLLAWDFFCQSTFTLWNIYRKSSRSWFAGANRNNYRKFLIIEITLRDHIMETTFKFCIFISGKEKKCRNVIQPFYFLCTRSLVFLMFATIVCYTIVSWSTGFVVESHNYTKNGWGFFCSSGVVVYIRWLHIFFIVLPQYNNLILSPVPGGDRH